MGFFDKILKAIGFENVEEENDDKKNKKQRITSSKFDLRNKNTKKEEKEQKSVEVNTPKTQGDIENISLKLLDEESILVNLSNFSEEDKKRALDFLSGASFVLKFKINKIEENLFFISKNIGENVE